MKKFFLISLILCSFLTISYQTPINAQTYSTKTVNYSINTNLFPIKQDNKWGYIIDKSGKTVINPQFFSATSFSESLAAVRFKQNDLHPAFIDKTGKVFFYLPNETAGNFAKTDITEVTSQDLGYEKSSYNLSNFKASITFENRAFSENLISVRINNKYGYII